MSVRPARADGPGEGERASETEGTPRLAFDAPGRATITLNRPRHLNRLHREDLLALQGHIRCDVLIIPDPDVKGGPIQRLPLCLRKDPKIRTCKICDN